MATTQSSGYENYGTRLEMQRNDNNTVWVCRFCGEHLHDHDRERVYPADGPAGHYQYRYTCPSGFTPDLTHVEEDD